ncbi:MAG: glutamate racemase [Bacteroidota bacterium]
MDRRIGIFDSGVGGTSIWREIVQFLPNESTTYLADSKNAPYGTRSKGEILRLSIKNTEILLEKGAKIIVVACNTATTNAIAILRKNYPVPFIGIEPAIKPAALRTKSGKVGVLATKGTLTSNLFHNTSKIHAAGIEVFEQEGEGLVELVEAGKAQSKEAQDVLEKYVSPMLKEGIDCLVLGCTHYPYLIPILKKIVPQNIQIIDSGFAVAKQTKAILESHGLLNVGARGVEYVFFTNGNTDVLKSMVSSGAQISYRNF